MLPPWLVGDPTDGGTAGAGRASLEDLGHSVAGTMEGGRWEGYSAEWNSDIFESIYDWDKPLIDYS